jgi:lysyl endopeptidase
MKKNLLFLLGILSSIAAFGQQGDGGNPRGEKVSSGFKNTELIVFEEPDIAALRAEDAETDDTGTAPWRFGHNNYTNLGLNNSGNWYDLPNGDKIWLLKITCENALTVNLTFDQTVIPEGNELYVYNPDKTFILGKFNANHLYEGELGTELVPGNTVIVEYYVPAINKEDIGNVHVYRVTHGYRTAQEFMTKAFGSSGNCNMNVNCPDGAEWVNQRNSAVMLVSGGSGFCSGALINNTLNDGKPYVLTANHCYSTPTSWVFRFNWQATACTNPGSSPTFQSLSGAVLRSRRTPSDFCLVEITGGLVGGTVPLSYSPYFSGWDNSGVNPSSTVSIHHPSGDIKKIAFDDAAASPATAMGSESQGVWQVEWDRNTTTEGGSSGSPLFDQNRRIIGQLWGGGASCSNLSAPDYYGRLSKSWNPASSNSTNHLVTWLDPNSSGAQFIDGYDPNNSTPIAIDAGLANPTGASGTYCSTQISPSMTITNSGTTTLTSATINYGINGNYNLNYSWSGSLAQWQSTTITLPVMNVPGGAHTFNAQVVNPNGSTDENLANNAVSSTFTAVVNGQSVQLTLDLDCYGSETTWQLRNDANVLLYSGSGYQDNDEGVINVDFCLAYDCYTFTINDSYGDGLTGCTAANGGAGSYQILYNSAVVAQLTEANANFGDSDSQNFCIQDVTGLDESSLVSKVFVYPNPANELLNIAFIGLTAERVELLSVHGQVILSSNQVSDSATFDISKLASGTYFIKVITASGNALKQIIIK